MPENQFEVGDIVQLVYIKRRYNLDAWVRITDYSKGTYHWKPYNQTAKDYFGSAYLGADFSISFVLIKKFHYLSLDRDNRFTSMLEELEG